MEVRRLAPPVSSQARQTIKTAFEDLQQAISPADSREFRSVKLDDVRTAALNLEKELAGRRALRYMRRLSPLFKGLEHYSKVVEVLCNGTPYLPWVWAPISLILRIASEYLDAFEQIIKGYARIAGSLSRFEILSNAFVHDQDFQQILAVFYADILNFHKHAYQFVRRTGWKILFLTSWGRFQRRFNGILDDMVKHEELIDLGANARNIAESRRMHEEIRTWREAQLETVSREEEEQAANQYRSIVSWLKVDDSDQLAIFDSLSAQGSKYPGTCSWILKISGMKAWLQRTPEVPMLCLQGTPGSGKSVLSSQLVSFIRTNSFVAHHFCTYLYGSSTKYEQILKSLFLQILRRDADICSHAYNECILAKKSPTIPNLEQILQTMLSSLSNGPNKTEYVWIIVDGLDECEEDKQARLVSLFNQILSKGASSRGTVCKIMMTSRLSSILLKRMRKRQVISLTDEKSSLEGAIRLYASERLRSLRQKLDEIHVSQDAISEIELAIVKKANGMFLYARLVLDHLEANIFFNTDEIKAAVEQLPRKLSDFYHEILSRILVYLDNRSKQRVKCVLGWIAFAKRPLKKLELLSAVSFSEGNVSPGHIAPKYMLDICGPLIEERYSDTIVSFIHVSVKEFLQSLSSNLLISEPEAHLQHAVASVTCLLSGLEVFHETYSEHERNYRVVRGIHGLHLYATEFWTEYLLSSGEFGANVDESSALLAVACQLATKLDSDTAEDSTSILAMKDSRLKHLEGHPVLYKQVARALVARSLQNLEASYQEDQIQDGPSLASPEIIHSTSEGISATLESYQATVRFLLSITNYPGVTAEEFGSFKCQFRSSAYTCRLSACSRATVGFESDKARLEHERSHIRLRCTFPSCQYPLPFGSNQSLKRHVDKYHNTEPPRQSLRRVRPSVARVDNLPQPLKMDVNAPPSFAKVENLSRPLEMDVNVPRTLGGMQTPSVNTVSDIPGLGPFNRLSDSSRVGNPVKDWYNSNSKEDPRLTHVPKKNVAPNLEPSTPEIKFSVFSQVVMDNMDLPDEVLASNAAFPPEVKKWRDLKRWLTGPLSVRLCNIQMMQFRQLEAEEQALDQQKPTTPKPQPEESNQLSKTGNIPPEMPQLTGEELNQIRTRCPDLAHWTNEQLRRGFWVTAGEINRVRASVPKYANATDEEIRLDIILKAARYLTSTETTLEVADDGSLVIVE